MGRCLGGVLSAGFVLLGLLADHLMLAPRPESTNQVPKADEAGNRPMVTSGEDDAKARYRNNPATMAASGIYRKRAMRGGLLLDEFCFLKRADIDFVGPSAELLDGHVALGGHEFVEFVHRERLFGRFLTRHTR